VRDLIESLLLRLALGEGSIKSSLYQSSEKVNVACNGCFRLLEKNGNISAKIKNQSSILKQEMGNLGKV